MVQMNLKNISIKTYVINNKIRVAYSFPTQYGSIYGNRRIEKYMMV